MKDEVDFLPADKRQRFLQIDNIILGVCGQGCPNYPKQQVLIAYKLESFLQIDTMIFDWDGQIFPKFVKNKFAMSLQYLKKRS